MIPAALGALSLLIWLYLLLARGGFWRMITDDQPPESPPPPRRIAVIIPARDESSVVGDAVRSLLQQDYPGSLHIFLVDDHSSDGTAQAALCAAGQAQHADALTVVQARDLPSGWTGKLWAVSEGLQSATPFSADYLLLTDADILHQPGNLASLVARAEAGGFDLVSQMVKLRAESWAERLLIPPFIFFFFKLYPPRWVAQPDRRTAAAAGGCMLIRPVALARIGGIAAIRHQLIDDCALARAMKSHGRIWLGPTSQATSLRPYDTFREIGRMISRSAFTQLRHSALLLLGAILAMVVTYLVPPLLLFCGRWPAALGVTAWLLQVVAFLPTLRFYRLSPLRALSLPLVACFYLAATLHSALAYWTGRGGVWKGRIQDPAHATIRHSS